MRGYRRHMLATIDKRKRNVVFIRIHACTHAYVRPTRCRFALRGFTRALVMFTTERNHRAIHRDLISAHHPVFQSKSSSGKYNAPEHPRCTRDILPVRSVSFSGCCPDMVTERKNCYEYRSNFTILHQSRLNFERFLSRQNNA